MSDYHAPKGGLPPQTRLMTGRAVFTEAYAVIPAGVMRDIVTSFLPGWTGTRAWIIARPMTGFAETFSHYLMEVAPGGGSEAPEPEMTAPAVTTPEVIEPAVTVPEVTVPAVPAPEMAMPTEPPPAAFAAAPAPAQRY